MIQKDLQGNLWECKIYGSKSSGKTFQAYQQEIKRLNNIINELEKDLKEASNCLVYNELVNGKDLINNILNDLKELKENK